MKLNASWLLGILSLILFVNVQAKTFEVTVSKMTQEQKGLEAQSFRANYQLIEGMKKNSKSHREILIKIAENEITKQQFLSKTALNKKQIDRILFSYAAGVQKTMLGDKYIVELMYDYDGQYPVMYGGSSTFRDNKSANFTKTNTEKILSDFLGQNHKNLNAKLLSVYRGVSISVEIDTPEQFDLLLIDSQLLGVTHLGNPPNAGIIFSDD